MINRPICGKQMGLVATSFYYFIFLMNYNYVLFRNHQVLIVVILNFMECNHIILERSGPFNLNRRVMMHASWTYSWENSNILSTTRSESEGPQLNVFMLQLN